MEDLLPRLRNRGRSASSGELKMKTLCTLILLTIVRCGPVCADEVVAVPKDVPPVVGTAIMSNDSEKWVVQLTIPKITWKVVGERRPKMEWPEFQVNVEEAVLKLSMGYGPATQLSGESQNRLVDLKGRRLKRDEALKRLKGNFVYDVQV